jgi:hypothetical protein
VDSTNNSSSRLYYTYTTNGTTYEVTAAMESQKYKAGGSGDVITNDGGTKESVYEKGTNLALEPLDYGDTSLVGHWAMDEGVSSTAYDYSGNGSMGIWNGNATGTSGYYSPGKVGPWAGAFDGTSTYINLGNAGNLNTAITGNAFTLSVWVYATTSSIPGGLAGIFSSAQSIPWRFGLRYYASSSAYDFYVNAFTNPDLLGPALTINTWQLLTVTFSRTGGMAFYSNGALFSTKAYFTSPTSNADSFYIGVDYLSNSGRIWPGLIDDVRLYNRALSTAEIQSLYSGGK